MAFSFSLFPPVETPSRPRSPPQTHSLRRCINLSNATSGTAQRERIVDANSHFSACVAGLTAHSSARSASLQHFAALCALP